MMSHSAHPDEHLAAILAKGARRDKAEKLQKLHELCSLEFSRNKPGLRDFSVSRISRLAEEKGLFAARSIYNKQSEDYQGLIKAWAAYDGPKSPRLIPVQRKAEERYSFLAKIEDPAVRRLCHIALVERDKLRSDINLLKSKTEVLVDLRPLGVNVARGATNVAIVETLAQLTDSERTALAAAIDAGNLSRRKWRVGETGEILDERDRFVFFPGFASAIRKVLGVSTTSTAPIASLPLADKGDQ